MDNPAATGNADQIEFWNGPAGQGWAELNDRLDAMLRPLGRAAMTATHQRRVSMSSTSDAAAGIPHESYRRGWPRTAR